MLIPYVLFLSPVLTSLMLIHHQVYTTSILDLSQHDLEITIPNITDNRFWAFPFYDFYGNNFGSVSIAVVSPVGTYLIRRASDALVQPGIEYTTPNALCPYPKYTGYINFPTTYGSLWNRILVRQNTTADLDIVHSYQRNISITPVPRQISQPGTLPAPPLTAELFASNKTGTAKLLDLLARFAQFNQPEVLSDAYRVASILGLAGLAGGVYTPPAGVNLTQVVGAVSANAGLTTSTPKDTLVLGNGWYTGTSNISGNFGVDYAVRAYTAETGYLQLAEDIAVYPVYKSGPAGDALEGDEALLFTFSGRPPVNVDGFWSLTLYGEVMFLFPQHLPLHTNHLRPILTPRSHRTNTSSPTRSPATKSAIAPPPSASTTADSSTAPTPAERMVLFRF